MIQQLYHEHLKSQLSRSQYQLLKILLIVLQSVKVVSLESLASALPIPITFESRRKKLQRFLSLPNFTIRKIWLPIITAWLEIFFKEGETVYLVIDRTTWGKINLLMISVVWEKRSIPIYFKLLKKKGNSNYQEQTKALSKVLGLFKKYKVCLLADREFFSAKLAKWLRSNNLSFCLRLKKSHYIKKESELFTDLQNLGLEPGMSLFIAGVNVTKNKGFGQYNLACKWSKKIRGKVPKEGWFILTDLPNFKQAIEAYKKRFDIEEMFRDFKSGGYNLESTKVSGKRFIALVLLISLAYLLATIQGREIKRKGVQKYIGRVKETGRYTRRHSSFYIGLYGYTWVNFQEICRELVEELMRMSPNKRRYYQQGQRAMRLVISTL